MPSHWERSQVCLGGWLGCCLKKTQFSEAFHTFPPLFLLNACGLPQHKWFSVNLMYPISILLAILSIIHVARHLACNKVIFRTYILLTNLSSTSHTGVSFAMKCCDEYVSVNWLLLSESCRD